MAVRFRKTLNLGRGLKVNISKSSVGVSAGMRGAHVSLNSKGRKTISGGIPGTGLYVSKSINGGSSNADSDFEDSDIEIEETRGIGDRAISVILLVASVILIAISALLAIAVPVAGILGIVFGVIIFQYGRRLKKRTAVQAKSDISSDEI